MTQTAGSDVDATGVFPRRPRPGIVMGLRAGQITLLGTAGLVLILALFTGAFPNAGRGVVLGVAAALVLLAVGTVEDRPAYRWLAARASHATRARLGHTTAGRPIRVGTLPHPRVGREIGLLPGRHAAITVHELDGVAYLFHPHEGTITAIVEVTSPEFLLRDPADRNARVAGWGRVLAAATRTGAIRQLQLLERSTPDDGSALAAYTNAHASTRPEQQDLVHCYRDLTAGLRGGADQHQTFLAVTVDRSTATGRIKTAGGRIGGLIAAWRQEYTLLARLLPAAGLDVVDELSAERVAQVVRSGFDPYAALDIPADGISLAQAGPAACREQWDHVRADGAFHAVLWVAEWPNTHVAADVLWPVVFPPGVHRTLSLFYRPYTRAQSQSAIRAKHSEIIQSSWLKDKLGRVETLTDTRELNDVLARESELLAGHGEVGLLGLITVTAPSADQLVDAVTSIHAAGTQAGLDLRRVYGQQLQAFTAAALPLGIPVVTP